MADSGSIQFELDRDFFTNGKKIPGNTRLSSEDLRGIMRNEKNEPLSAAEAVDLAHELIQRQKRHNQYMQGIHEKHDHMQDAGSIAMGSGS